MRADYDSEGDTIQIDLEAVDRLDYGDDEVDDRIVVGIRDERPVRVDVIGTGGDIDGPLRSRLRLRSRCGSAGRGRSGRVGLCRIERSCLTWAYAPLLRALIEQLLDDEGAGSAGGLYLDRLTGFGVHQRLADRRLG